MLLDETVRVRHEERLRRSLTVYSLSTSDMLGQSRRRPFTGLASRIVRRRALVAPTTPRLAP